MHARALIVLASVLALAVLALLVWDRADDLEQLTAAPDPTVPARAPVEAAADLVVPEREPVAEGRAPADEPTGAATPKPAGGLLFVCTFAGRCVDEQGRPLAGARVRCNAGFGELFSRADTDAEIDGDFALALTLPARRRGKPIELVASLAGHASRTLQPIATDGRVELGDVVLGRAGSLSGRVVDEHGAGFSGAMVAVTGVGPRIAGLLDDGPQDTWAVTTSGDDGVFRMEDVPAGDVRVWAGAEGRRWATSDDLRVRPGEELRDVELRVDPVPAEEEIGLLVVDPEDRPVPHALVGYHYRGEGQSGSGSTEADEDGRLDFVIPVRTDYDFTASDPEGKLRPGVARSVAPGTVDRVIRLGEARALTLEVRGPDGPVAEFSGRVRSFHEDRGLSGPSVRTEAGDVPGRAVLQLPVEPFEVTVEAEGFARTTLGRFDPEEIGETLAVVLVPLPGVTGRVLDERGAPMPGARVSLHAAVGANEALVINGFPARSQRHPEARVTSDDEGRFRLTPQEAGSFYLRAEVDGKAPRESGPFELTPDLGASGLEVVLVPGGAIEGRVLVPANDSAAGRIVGISRGDGHGVTARTDAAGRFRFEHLTPGPWLVRERREEISPGSTTSSMGATDEPVPLPWSCTVTDGATMRFDLDLTNAARAVLAGRLLFDSAPAVGWEASLRREPSGAEVASDRVDSQGRFRLEASEPGPYRLQVVGLWQDSPMMFVLQELDLAAGEGAWDLDLPLGRIEGTASLGEGERLVYTWTRDDGLSLGCDVTPGPDGTFGLPVPAGAGRLEQPVEGESELHRPVEVQPAGVLWVEWP